MSQEWSPPYTKEHFPTLCELGDRKEVNIGGKCIPFGHGDSVEKCIEGGIQQRMGTIRPRMSAIKKRENAIE
jgi:hypothetical protein